MGAESQDASFRPSLGISVRLVSSIGRFLVGVLCSFCQCWFGLDFEFAV